MEDQNVQEQVELSEQEQSQDPVVEEQEAQVSPQPSQNDVNIRNLRQKAEQLERENRSYHQRLQEIEAQKQASQQEETTLNPDDLVEWKYVQRELKKVKDELTSYKQQSQATTAESRVKMQYPDFDTVVNETNIAALRQDYPELAATINSNTDLYTKASAAYTLIKKLNIAPDTQYAQDRNRAQENTAKPRPLNSISPQQGDSPLSRANAFAQGLTPELKSQLLKEMQDAKKNM